MVAFQVMSPSAAEALTKGDTRRCSSLLIVSGSPSAAVIFRRPPSTTTVIAGLPGSAASSAILSAVSSEAKVASSEIAVTSVPSTVRVQRSSWAVALSGSTNCVQSRSSSPSNWPLPATSGITTVSIGVKAVVEPMSMNSRRPSPSMNARSASAESLIRSLSDTSRSSADGTAGEFRRVNAWT